MGKCLTFQLLKYFKRIEIEDITQVNQEFSNFLMNDSVLEKLVISVYLEYVLVPIKTSSFNQNLLQPSQVFKFRLENSQSGANLLGGRMCDWFLVYGNFGYCMIMESQVLVKLGILFRDSLRSWELNLT